MGATNHTTNCNLSQFIGIDKPAWLQDYNGDMSKIDAGIHQAKQAADTAQLDATQAITNSGLNTTAIGNLQTDVGLLQTATGNNAGAINSINSLIGNGTPTTTDHTIIGGINELNANKVEHTLAATVTGDGVKTLQQLIHELKASIGITKLKPDSYIKVEASGNIFYGSLVKIVPANDIFNFRFDTLAGNNYVISEFSFNNTEAWCQAFNVSITDVSTTFSNSNASTPTDTISIYY